MNSIVEETKTDLLRHQAEIRRLLDEVKQVSLEAESKSAQEFLENQPIG